MKKFFALLIVTCLLTLLNGCGVSESDYKQLKSEYLAVKQELLRTQKEINATEQVLETLRTENSILKSQINKYKLEIKGLKAELLAKTRSEDKKAATRKLRVYVVKPGDTLWRIARMANVSVDELKKINNIKDASIKVGQELLLP